MPKSMFSILCILILLFFFSLIKVTCDRVVDGDGDEDHPGGVPIIVVHAEIEECKGAEYRICEVAESFLCDCVYKRVVEGNSNENYPALAKSTKDIHAAEEQVCDHTDDGIGQAEPEFCLAAAFLNCFDVVFIIIVIIVVIVIITVNMDMLSVGNFNATEVDFNLITVIRLNEDGCWADLNLGCIV